VRLMRLCCRQRKKSLERLSLSRKLSGEKIVRSLLWQRIAGKIFVAPSRLPRCASKVGGQWIGDETPDSGFSGTAALVKAHAASSRERRRVGLRRVTNLGTGVAQQKSSRIAGFCVWCHFSVPVPHEGN
jgi:hypothetical protein